MNQVETTQMSREEALRQIQEISTIIESSHKLLVSGTLAIFYGIAVLMIPIIEKTTNQLMFNFQFGENQLMMKAIAHVVFYAFVFLGLKHITEKLWPHDFPNTAHPVLAHALAFHRPIVLASCGTIFVLGSLNLEPLIPAFIFIFLGILFNQYGRLSDKFVKFLSWTYIWAGLILAYCSRFGNPDLWMWFSSYLGLSFVALGIYVKVINSRSSGIGQSGN